MLDDARNELPIHDLRQHHFRHWCLLKDTLLLSLYRQVDVDVTALGGGYLRSKTILAEEDRAAVGAVKLERGSTAGDLHREARRARDGNGRDDRVDEQRAGLAREQRDGVDFAFDHYCRLRARIEVHDL